MSTPQAPEQSPDPNEKQDSLNRSLSHGQLTMIAMGLALGTGLFLGSSSAIKIAGPGAIISYAIGSTIAAIIAACAGEMSVRHPVQGGFGTIASRYLNPFSGYITRWAYWATTVPLDGAELVAVGHYLAFWFPQIPLWASVTFFGLLILTLNLVSVKSFGALEFLLSSIKVSAVIVFMIIGILLVFVGLPNHEATGVQNLVNDGGFLPNGPASIWISMAVVMFSFGGVEMISLSAAEAKDPAHSVASSVKAMIWRLSTFYVVSMAIILCLIPWQSAAQNSDLTESPFVMVFSEMGIPFAADIMNFVVLVAALSGANASLYAATRLIHALGADRMAPAVAARTSSRGVPTVALLISFTGVVVATVMAVAKIGDIFALLMALVTLCILVVWIMILSTYQAYKKDQGNASSFTVLGGRITAALALAGVLATLVALFFLDGSGVQQSIMVGIAFFLLISIGYVVASKRQGGFKRPDLDAMHDTEEAQALSPTVSPDATAHPEESARS